MPPIKKQTKLDLLPELAGETSPWYKMIFYGKSKVGKTTLAASAVEVAEMRDVLVMSNGTGVNTLRGEPDFADVSILTVREWEQYTQIYEWLADGAVEKYKTVIWDEADHSWLMRAREIMKEVVAERPSQNENVLSPREYGIVRMEMLSVLDKFLTLPCHFIMTTWAEISPDPHTGINKMMISTPGKLASELPGRVDCYVYMETQQPRKKPGQVLTEEETRGQRIAYFAPTVKFEAGVWGRSKAVRLGTEMVEPTMSKIFAKLENK